MLLDLQDFLNLKILHWKFYFERVVHDYIDAAGQHFDKNASFPPQSLTPATVGNAALSSPSSIGSLPTSSGSVLSSSGSGSRERERKPEGHQDVSGGALPQPVACHPTPTALLPLILPAESPHPAPRKQIIMGRPGTGRES